MLLEYNFKRKVAMKKIFNFNIKTIFSSHRYFIVGATFNLSGGNTATQVFGHKRKDFPTIKKLIDVVRKFHDNASNVVILSVCEVKEEEYKKFFSEQ